MRIEKGITTSWAQQLQAECSEQVIAQFEGMRESMLSGDSGLLNTWEEICAQVQGEESSDWDTYTGMIEDFILANVKQLPKSAQLALWAQTETGWDWIYDHFAEDDSYDNAPLDFESITQLIKGAVLSEAADYESPTLYRYRWDADDPQFDEDEDDEVVAEVMNESATVVAWCPPNVDQALCSVMIPKGEVTERDWWMALADRVTELVEKSANPEQAMLDAARQLKTENPDYPAQAGQCLVQHNLILRTVMSRMIDQQEDDIFPAKVVRGNNQAFQAMDETTLEDWLNLASAAVSESSLD